MLATAYTAILRKRRTGERCSPIRVELTSGPHKGLKVACSLDRGAYPLGSRFRVTGRLVEVPSREPYFRADSVNPI